jgi:polar amino acid transport system substrate-binding protein
MRQQKVRTAFLASLSVFVAIALSASGATAQDAAPIKPPASIADAGEIVFCADMTVPPHLYVDEGNKPTGADVEMGEELAKLMGVKAVHLQVGFDGLIAGLQGNKCDAINSNMYVKPARAEVIDFVVYSRAGEALLVKKGNPKKITDLPDLSGRRISGTVGSTTEAFLRETSKQLEASDKAPIDVVVFPKETDTANALIADKIDGAWLSSVSVDFYVRKSPEEFDSWGSKVYNASEVGIGVRKSDKELKDALARGVATMYENGSMCRILEKYNIQSTALESKPCPQ